MNTDQALLEIAVRERQFQMRAAFYLWVIQKVAKEIMDRPGESSLQKQKPQRTVAP